MILKSFLHLSITAFALLATATAAEPLIQLKKGDHVAIVGSGLADRQQHQAWFESLIQKAFPEMELTMRNFGFAADEINLHPRSDGVPPIEWYLAMKKGVTKKTAVLNYHAGTDFGADVIFAYWGFNESFRGPQGLAEFKKNLTTYLSQQLAANYSGEGAPRIVLFSPIGNEDLRSPDHPDGAANNANLKLYTVAMAEVAQSLKVPFVDLFTPSLALYSKAAAPLTINGIHLTDEGDKQLAPVQFKAVFGTDPVATTDPAVAKIRAAVLDKNTEWHHRYRSVDQFNIYGYRGTDSYKDVNDPTKLINNNLILGQEMTQRDVKTENRDKRVWAVAQGKELVVVDDNLPPVSLTPPNFPDGVPYMEPEESLKHFTLPANCKLELIGSEKTFPDLINPVQMSFDTKGRLWLAVWPSYPEVAPTAKVFDKILVCDLDPVTGKIAKMTTFADGLNCPTGFQFYKDGVILIQSPDILYLRDTDGDGKADTRERILHGLDAADSHHETNSICYEPGGAVYLSDGVFHRSNVETVGGPIRNTDGAIYRYEPVTGKFMRHAPYNFMNPHGRVFDYWGNDIITDATGNNNYFGPAMSGHLDTGVHSPLRTFWPQPSRPCAGTTLLSSRHFPDDWQGEMLNANVIGMLGIFRVKISDQGSGIIGESREHLISADLNTNPYFRPSGITVAPDGSLYFMDWSQYLIGHLQHHLRDPNRDHAHGRLYRITYEGRPLLKPKKIDGESIANLLPLLKEPENDVRLRAKMELAKHDAKEVAAATVAWVKTLDPKEASYEHHLLEALWVHQWNNIVNLELLGRVLKSTEPRARAQAIRVIGYWQDRVPGALAMVKAAADDAAPRVRLEAVRVASFFREAAAADAALTVLKHPMDDYLSYTLGETMKQLTPWWKDAVRTGKELAADNPVGISYLVNSVATAELVTFPKSRITSTAMLTRADVGIPARLTALAELSKLKASTTPTATMVSVLMAAPKQDDLGTTELATLLLQQPTADLKSARASLAALSVVTQSDALKQAISAALMTTDGSVLPAAEAAKKSPQALIQFLGALPRIVDPALRTAAYPLVKNLLAAPATGASLDSASPLVRFIRISIPGPAPLSLAEVEVFSNGKNVALAGKATQETDLEGGVASHANDGNTNGGWGHGSVTHTEGSSPNPWWELDLGSELPIQSVVIWNRTDGELLSQRLADFNLTALDAKRQEVYRKLSNPAPPLSAKFALSEDTAGLIRRAAIHALADLGKEPPAVFAILASLIKKNDQVPTATQAITRLPAATWPKDQAAIAVKGIMDWAATLTAEARTTPEYLATVAVANQLAAILPPAQATAATSALAGLSVATHTVKCVPGEIRYDLVRIVAEAGKPLHIVFQNPDAMPHNLVFLTPGALPEYANTVQTQAPDKLDAKGRAYIIDGDPRVLAATKLVPAGQTQSLDLTAPTAEGTYLYACTFPGHWSIMKGELIVTKDLAAYLAAHPEK